MDNNLKQADVAGRLRHHRPEAQQDHECAGLRPRDAVEAIGLHDGVNGNNLDQQIRNADGRGKIQKARMADAMQIFDENVRPGEQTSVQQRVEGLLPPVHRNREQRRANDDQDRQEDAAGGDDSDGPGLARGSEGKCRM